MIVLLLVTRNQADLLQANLAHHLAWGFDHVCVADHGSTDGTQDVLAGFRDVSSMPIAAWTERGDAFAAMLRRLEERHGAVDWAAVSDTDELWWDGECQLRTLLADVPDDKEAVMFGQKLFLPTELDPPGLPLHCARRYRASGRDSPLLTSYRSGKTVYRGRWLRGHRVAHMHWSPELPHRRWRYGRDLVHHYMVKDEDDFVRKLEALPQITPRLRRRAWRRRVRDLLSGTRRRSGLNVRAYREEWWRVYRDGGEAAAREYYRTRYVIHAEALQGHLERGELVFDPAFAEHKLQELERV
jgi:glycosyltransferase involved in cell wall biosynthesis